MCGNRPSTLSGWFSHFSSFLCWYPFLVAFSHCFFLFIDNAARKLWVYLLPKEWCVWCFQNICKYWLIWNSRMKKLFSDMVIWRWESLYELAMKVCCDWEGKYDFVDINSLSGLKQVPQEKFGSFMSCTSSKWCHTYHCSRSLLLLNLCFSCMWWEAYVRKEKTQSYLCVHVRWFFSPCKSKLILCFVDLGTINIF